MALTSAALKLPDLSASYDAMMDSICASTGGDTLPDGVVIAVGTALRFAGPKFVATRDFKPF
jgi:hypothetical protein